MKHIFFEFDGVISPFVPRALSRDAITPLTSPSGYDISYRNDVVAWMNDLAAQDGVKLYWLTTWTNQLNQLAPTGVPKNMINITPLRYEYVREGFWKGEAGSKKAEEIFQANPDDIVVRIDSDYIPVFGVAGVVAINPDRYVGLTQEDMHYISSL